MNQALVFGVNVAAGVAVGFTIFVRGDVDVVTSACVVVSVDFWSCSYWC